METKKKEGGLLSPAGFILTSFPRVAHTSWNSLNYAPSMVQRSKLHSEKYCVTGCVLWRSYFTLQQLMERIQVLDIQQLQITRRLQREGCRSDYYASGVLEDHKCLER